MKMLSEFREGNAATDIPQCTALIFSKTEKQK
jgi:hypothetical protein